MKMPTKIEGSAAGTATFQIKNHWFAPSVRATS
jgi:hypothetical protein